jgi:glyoxylase-like metal-dependent hydrolase (beta-lactamase superfamily II)
MKLYSLQTGNLKLDGGTMFGIIPKVMWSKVYPADENNLCNFAMRCLLVDTGERKILIENGIGNKQSDKFFGNFHLNGMEPIETSLAGIGLSSDDITDVLLTHLHFDHCGGSIVYNDDRTRLVPAFKNAVYRIGERQWNWATNPNNREKGSYLKENFLPVKESGQLEFITKEGFLLPGIDVRILNGHTKGQVIPYIHYNGKTVVFVSDLLPCTAYIPLPWVMAYDIMPLLSVQEKEAFLKEALENDYILFFYHDIYHECCNLKMTDKGIRAKETFGINDA